jgi:hypothetical protein
MGLGLGRQPRVPVEYRFLRCAAGHEIRLEGNRAVLHVYDQPGETVAFNYCPVCFGQWAQTQWPLTEVRRELETFKLP